jgi:hypothetical protein
LVQYRYLTVLRWMSLPTPFDFDADTLEMWLSRATTVEFKATATLAMWKVHGRYHSDLRCNRTPVAGLRCDAGYSHSACQKRSGPPQPAAAATILIFRSIETMKFTFNDGGRAAAGYKGETRDCVCRSIAIATGLPYQEIYDAINELGQSERTGKWKRGKSSARTGVYKASMRRYIESLGWRWVPTMQIGSGCKVHLREDELPGGRLMVSLSRHLTVVIDGVIHDIHDPARDGTRCVYGYFIQPGYASDGAEPVATL